MSDERFQYGDRVRHPQRPEWGVGSVVKVERITADGELTDRVTVRFPNAGLKTLSSRHAKLQRVVEPASTPTAGAREGVAAYDKMSESGWLAPMAHRKVEEVMIGLPEEAKDPFTSLKRRLKFTLDLYRFDSSGRGLIDWAVAQSGLDDPLGRFSRQELEQLFDRWAVERDSHLRRLLDEARSEQAMVRELVSQAPSSAQQSVRRLTARR